MNKQLNLTDIGTDSIYDIKKFSSGTGMRGVATFRNHETGEVIWKQRDNKSDDDSHRLTGASRSVDWSRQGC